MESFIYAFNEEARDTLLSKRYQLLKSDPRKHIYVFVNKDGENFMRDNTQFVLSNTLTF